MMFWLSLVYSIVVPLGVLFVPKGLLANRIMKEIRLKKLGILRKLINYIPWYNSYVIKKEINGSAPGYLVLTVLAAIVFAALIPARFIYFQIEGVQLLMTIVVLLFLFVSYLAEMFLLYTICDLIDKKKLLWSAFVPFFCHSLLLPHIAPYFKAQYDRIHGVFDGNNN